MIVAQMRNNPDDLLKQGIGLSAEFACLCFWSFKSNYSYLSGNCIDKERP